MKIIERARRYLLHLPGSIAGHNGDHCLFMAAFHLVVGFDLNEQTALELLLEFMLEALTRVGGAAVHHPGLKKELFTKLSRLRLIEMITLTQLAICFVVCG